MSRERPSSERLQQLAAQVELCIFDVDGVLTDGGLHYGPQGEVQKRFDVKDGHGIVMARLTGLPCAILTARTSEIVALRAKELGIAHVLQGQKDKRAGLTALLGAAGVAAAAAAYMGDDVNDLGPMAMVALSACPADAAPEVRQEAAFVSRRPGGGGAARELLELVLKATGRWERALTMMRGVPDDPL